MARTSLITAAAIAGVASAGTAAIVANVGILNAAESSELGTLSAADDLIPAEPQVVDVYLDDPASTSTTVTGLPGTEVVTGAPSAAAPANRASATANTPTAAVAAGPAAKSGPNASSQTFAVADAGTVTVTRSTAGLGVGDVVAKPGWTSRVVRADASIVVVAFSSGGRTLELTATPGPDGSIAASIAESTAAVPPPPPPVQTTTTTVAPQQDDDDDELEYDEHEGGEDER